MDDQDKTHGRAERHLFLLLSRIYEVDSQILNLSIHSLKILPLIEIHSLHLLLHQSLRQQVLDPPIFRVASRWSKRILTHLQEGRGVGEGRFLLCKSILGYNLLSFRAVQIAPKKSARLVPHDIDSNVRGAEIDTPLPHRWLLTKNASLRMKLTRDLSNSCCYIPSRTVTWVPYPTMYPTTSYLSLRTRFTNSSFPVGCKSMCILV